MEVRTLRVGELETNCYIAWDNDENVLVVDPGDEAALVIEELERIGGFVRYILLTHAHFDHVQAIDDLRFKYPKADIVLGAKDEVLLRSVPEQGELIGKRLPKVTAEILPVAEGSVLPFGKHEIKVMETPGHTRGGVCYFVDNILFTGDTIFYHTYGRTDLSEGDQMAIEKSLQRILAMPENLTVYPGHGRQTTVAEEKGFWTGTLGDF